MIIWSVTVPQGPAGSFVVRVSVTVPAVISAAFGVYTAFSAAALGLKVPVPPLQVPEEAAPPTEPASVTFGELAHTVWSIPAFAVATGLIVTVIGTSGPMQPPDNPSAT